MTIRVRLKKHIPQCTVLAKTTYPHKALSTLYITRIRKETARDEDRKGTQLPPTLL